MNISPADASEHREAFALLHGVSPDHSLVAHSRRMVASGELDPSGLFVARSRGTLVGAILARSLPGSIGLIIAARTLGDAAGVSRELTAAAVRHLSDAKVIQAFLSPEEMARSQALLDNGFRHVTRLLEMRKAQAIAGNSPHQDHFRIVPYSQVDAAEFQRILTLANQDSLDCPELDRLRTPLEMFVGFRDSSNDQSGWWLAFLDDEPVGVVLLSGEELSFLGVVPEWRRRGVGRFLLDTVCRLEQSLVLTVDARNLPAVQLYSSLGFEVVGGHEVFLKFPD